MKIALFVLAGLAVVSAVPRPKREAYALPDGAEILVGPVRTSFSCFNDGYYADTENNCKIFHVCHSVPKEDGSTELQQFSFLCGNQTVFNQLSLTCAVEEEAIPCSNAQDFFYVNDRVRVGDPKLYFLNDEDIQRAVPLVPALYSAYSGLSGAPAPGQGGRPGRG